MRSSRRKGKKRTIAAHRRNRTSPNRIKWDHSQDLRKQDEEDAYMKQREKLCEHCAVSEEEPIIELGCQSQWAARQPANRQ